MNECRRYAYRGHDIILRADEHRPGFWGWTFVIDGGGPTTGGSFAHPWAALVKGLSAARSTVDRMAH